MRYKDWTVDNWKRVIWSDESSIWIGVNPRHQWVIRPPGERLNQKYVKKTFKSAQVKVIVRGLVMDDGIRMNGLIQRRELPWGDEQGRWLKNGVDC